jgi:outer membrane protein TolC
VSADPVGNATARLAEAKVQGAINALMFAEEILQVVHDIEDARAEIGALRRRIEQGVTKV